MIQNGPVVIDGQLQTSVTTTSNMNHQLVAKSTDTLPLRVPSGQSTLNTTLHVNSASTPPCILNNSTASTANIAFRNRQKCWNAGMEAGNFRIKSNWISLESNMPAGTNVSPMVAVQINLGCVF